MKSVLCVDIGGSSTKAGIWQQGKELQHIRSIPTKPDAESFCDSLVSLLEQTLTEAPRSFEIKHLGVAVAGFLDSQRECLLYNPNIYWLEGFPLRQRLVEHFPSMEIELEVDSNAATMAEYRWGSGRGSKRFLCLTAGTGLGVGMTIDGEPLRFAYGCMGDAGHVIVLRDGPLCTCGGRGCAEVMISVSTIAERYQKNSALEQAVSLREVIEAAEQGDPNAVSVLHEAGEWLGIATASLANLFFPDHIALAGGLSAAGDFTLHSAEKSFRHSASILARHTTFTRATLGPTATLIGAGWPFWEKKNKR